MNADSGLLVGGGKKKNDWISSELAFEDKKCTAHKTRNYLRQLKTNRVPSYLVKKTDFSFLFSLSG